MFKGLDAVTSQRTNGKSSGLRTVYVDRWTEDVLEDKDLARRRNDVFVDGTDTTAKRGGMIELAEMLGA